MTHIAPPPAPFEPLVGTRLSLRPLRPSDLDAFLLITEDEEGLRLTGTPGAPPREAAQGWLASLATRTGRFDLAIELRESALVIGEIVLKDIDEDHRSASLRIGLRSAYTNRGYGSEALKLLLAFAFDQLGLHRVELEVFAFNPRAVHVYEKLGFRQEGRLRDVLHLGGEYHDAIVMAMLEDEYRAARAADA